MKHLLAAALLLTFAVSCKKDKSTDEEEFPYYFTATINGTSVNYQANDLNSQFECGTSSPYSALGDEYDIYEGTLIQDGNDPLKNNIYLHILKYFDHDPDLNEKIAMAQIGSYPYGISETSASTTDGISMVYTDGNGKEWFSEWGPQTGSNFTLSELTTNPDQTSLKIFKASFNCKLYDGAGGSIQISNAVIRGKIFNP